MSSYLNTNKLSSISLALLLSGFTLSVSTSAVQAASSAVPVESTQTQKLVTVYLLIDNIEELNRYLNDLRTIDKPNFNRVVFSFVKPALAQYTSGDLSSTGILGYFDKSNDDGNSVEAFNKLKEAVTLSKTKNIQTFLSVGGWNYSCNDKAVGTDCGPAGDHYDYFPDPLDPSEAKLAKTSYEKLIQLTNDLGMDGIDFDYEEFWHADKYAVHWLPSETADWSTGIANSILSAGGPTYANLIKYGSTGGAGNGGFVMPKTVDKVAAILHELADNPAAKNLKFATAAPPVGARPITGFIYGDNAPDIYTKGGVWWKGNLKGLWYSLTNKDKEIALRFDSLGLMTYDLCGDDAAVCAPYGGGPLDLAGQVGAYVKDYTTWLKTTDSQAVLTVSDIGKVNFLPAKYNLNTKVQFGFEVNEPAYPKNPQGQLQLTKTLVDKITQQQKNTDGVIIWQMYSQQNTKVPGSTTINYTLQKSCETFLEGDDRYDCHSAFPTSAK